MIHISRSVQPPNPNSAVPPLPVGPATAARRTERRRIADLRALPEPGGGSAEVRRPMRSESDRPGPSRDTESARHARLTATKPPIRAPREQPPEKDGAARTGPLRDELPETGHCSKRGPRKTNSSRNELHRTAAPEKRGFPKTNAQDEAFPKRASIPNRLRGEALRDGAIRPHAAIRGSVLPALPSRHAAGKPQPALRPCENALRTACRPKAARELRPNGVGARKIRPPLSRPRRPDGRR